MNESSNRLMDLRLREVINVHDGTRYGYVCDMEIDYHSGFIKSIIIPGSARLMGFLGRREDIIIPWDCIRKIGEDIILVDVPEALPPHQKDAK